VNRTNTFFLSQEDDRGRFLLVMTLDSKEGIVVNDLVKSIAKVVNNKS